MTKQSRIGAPNSIARYVTSNEWGNNKFAVVSKVRGEFVLIAAQSSLEGALRYCLGERQLVDIENIRLLEVPKGCGKATRVAGTNGGFMACGSTLRHLDQSVTVEFCPDCIVLVCTKCGNIKTIINAENLTAGQHDTTCWDQCGGKVTTHRSPNH